MTECYLFFLVRHEHMGDPSSICSKLDKSSDILKCLPDELYFNAGKHSRGHYMMSEPFDTTDPEGLAREFSHKLIALAETDKEVKKILSFEVTGIELQQRYSMNTWNISFPKFRFGSEDF